ncbi:2-oxoglutarate and iron-dependent oxygenase domain-containing protein [Neobacillus sp. PS3-34]|uniref:isopenicillin N synthase family dioxygenase n=1 Tax=Neobacillus sp. PS3-34 TaxID=3070678 RepID=UPI0027E00E52|nr:2-oxoglutarate and iron-dependent oxygenase domain-containing protein [Neobacillus sp. PS3-34]WML50053.1 2-oxoglutarate and iron-dependent oxygenase domain-containing protein [Neobacillus sp. PS3-34]
MTQPMIRTLNLKNFTYGNSEQRATFAEQFAAGLKETGFIILEGHGVDPKLIDRNYELWQELFNMDVETKKKYEGINGGQRGYTGFGKEHAKNRTVGDLKEFWHVGQELPVGHPLSSQYSANIWPTELPELQIKAVSFYRELERVARNMLEALAMHFDLRPNFFSDMIQDGNSILRTIHYPPLHDSMDPNAIRAAEHEDINLITLLVESTASGLELLTHDGEWMPVKAEKGQIIVDAGDMLSRISNEVIPATTHRVVNPEGENTARYSMPFFVHPYSNCLLETIPACISEDNPEKYPAITAGDFLYQRLVEIGLIKK